MLKCDERGEDSSRGRRKTLRGSTLQVERRSPASSLKVREANVKFKVCRIKDSVLKGFQTLRERRTLKPASLTAKRP